VTASGAPESVLVEQVGAVTTLTINRPEAYNALNADVLAALRDAVRSAEADPSVRAVVVTGAGEKAFSAGADLKELAGMSSDRAHEVMRSGQQVMRELERAAVPVIAAVNGVAAGGGFEIALACDIVIAAETARFGLPEPRVGLIAGAGGIHRLTRQIPLKHAMGLLLTGRLIGAEEAHRLGFVNEVVPAAELMDAAQRWAREILECSPLLLRLTKESAQDGFGRSVDDALARDWEERIPRMLASHDHAEGPKAFVSKRKPNWTGR